SIMTRLALTTLTALGLTVLAAGRATAQLPGDGDYTIVPWSSTSSLAQAIVIQVVPGQGPKVVAAGGIGIPGDPDLAAAVARYNLDGTLDAGFGTGGVKVIHPSTQDYAFALAVQPDQKLVAAGYTTTKKGGGSTDTLVARLTPAGALDTTFSGDGLTST